MDFGARLRAIRKEHGYSQETFAQELDKSRQAVSKWESGQGYPETETLIQISHMFGVTIDYLLKGEDSGNTANIGYYVSKEMLDGFMNYKRHNAKRIAIGIGLLIASSNFFLIPDRVIGVILTWLCVAVGIAILIWQKFLPDHYKDLYNKELSFDDITVKNFKSQYIINRKIYGILTISGALIIVLSVPVESILITYDFKGTYISVVQTSLFMIAAIIFILVGIPVSAENYILRTMDGIPQKKNKRSSWLYAAVPITVLCIMIGFVYNTWHPIIPVIVLICFLLYHIYKSLCDRERGGK